MYSILCIKYFAACNLLVNNMKLAIDARFRECKDKAIMRVFD